MYQPPSSHTSIGPSAWYIEKPSQLPISLFITFPSILPNQHSTLLPSGLPTDISTITPIKTPIRYSTQSSYNKPSWLSSFYQVQIPAGNHHTSLVQLLKCCKYWSQVEYQVIFRLTNQVAYITVSLLQFQAINLLTFLVVAQVIGLVVVHQFLWLCIPVLCEILHQPHLFQMFQVRNSVTTILHTDMPLIAYITEPSRYPTQSPYKRSWFSIF